MKAPTDPNMLTPDQEALHIASLLYGYIWESLTPEEHDELDNWVGESDQNMYLFEELTDERNIKRALDWLSETDGHEMARKLKARISFSDSGATIRVIRFAKRYAVAASLILLICSSAFFFYKTTSHRNNESAAPGQLASMQASTAAGSTNLITLPDGTRMWVNALSTVHYPAKFDSDIRKVSINGEVYFEVAPAINPATGKKKPFIVELENRGVTVEVLGTHFNINAYADEPVTKTTLLEGSIRISAGNETKLIQPGQQAQIGADHAITLTAINTDKALAWRDGKIIMEKGDDVSTLMRVLSRWYGIEVQYENNRPPVVGFTAAFEFGNKTLQEVMEVLKTNSIYTKLEGNKLIVSS